MMVRVASLAFRVVREGPVEALDTPEKIAEYIRDAFDADPTVEWFICIPMNCKNQPFGRVLITKGTASSCQVNPREVLRPVILSNAVGFVVAHNHPSGETAPSRADSDTIKTCATKERSMPYILDSTGKRYACNS